MSLQLEEKNEVTCPMGCDEGFYAIHTLLYDVTVTNGNLLLGGVNPDPDGPDSLQILCSGCNWEPTLSGNLESGWKVEF